MQTFKIFCKHLLHLKSTFSGSWRLGGLFLGVFLIFPLPFSRACGPTYYEFSGYSFLHGNLVEKGIEYVPYYLNFENLSQSLVDRDSVQMKGNLQEWQERFCNAATIPELEQVIYQTSIEELSVLRTAASSAKINLPSRLIYNEFARHLQRHKCGETIDYLIFAKQCEPHVTQRDDYWNAPKRDTETMQSLIDEGLRAFKRTDSHYIRLRYAYQLVRLAHYAHDYPRTLELYDFLMPKIDNSPSILEDWILGHKAGALMALGKNVEASYLYSLIFRRCPSKRESAYRSFKIETDEQWYQCQLLCQDDPERATLYALRAYAEDSKAAEEMAEIYRLDPKHESLELLLIREIRKLEKDLLGLEFNDAKQINSKYFDYPRKAAKIYLLSLQTLVQRLALEKKVRRPDLWRLADGYLKMLDGDLFAAKDSFAKLEKELEKGPLKEQLQAMQLGLKINLIDQMSYEKEEMIYDLMRDNPYYKQNRYLPDFIHDRMAFVYKRDKHPGLAFRCHYRMTDLRLNPQMDILDDLLFLSDSTNISTRKNRLHEAFMTDVKGNNIRNDLLDIKGTLLLSQGEWEAAKEVFRLIPISERDRYQFNPFTEQLIDCVECPLKLEDTVFYNKLELIDEIFELKYKARADMDFGAAYFYKLGLAHYNMTYFGNSWQVMDYFRSGANWDYDKDDIFDYRDSPFGNRENRDCSQAMAYFEKARTLAHQPELAAKAAFMAAKCEQNNYFISKDCDYRAYSNQMPNPPERYRYYFQLLKKQYANTAFYQEIIAECKYFAAYSRK